MKKSYLRKIIRESVREIMNEQSGCTQNNPNTQLALQELNNVMSTYPPISPNAYGLTPQYTNLIDTSIANGNCCPAAQKYQNMGNQLNNIQGSGMIPCDGKNPQWAVKTFIKILYAADALNNSGCFASGAVNNCSLTEQTPEIKNYTFKFPDGRNVSIINGKTTIS